MSDVERRRTTPWTPLAGAVIGALFFASIAGLRVLDPRETGWLMKGDWVPHFFGWHYFRIEPWHWPPGAVHGYYAPLGTSIGLTDAIPLVAYLLKPLDPWLPTPFQYLGLFLLLSFALQGALAARLLARRVASPAAQLLGATLFVLLPTLLVRVGHAALCAHWLILWALLLATREPATRFRPLAWAALGLTAGLVQPYLAAMVLGVLAGATLSPAPTAPGRRALTLAAAVAATVGGWWLSGLFLLRGGTSLTEGGLGYYSMNLLAFITPSGWSAFLPEWAVATAGQPYEGFQYLGLGLLGLCAAAALVRIRGRATPAAEGPLWSPWLVVACLVMTALAISPIVTLGRWTLLDAGGAWTAPLALFRSSGRFAWPLVYVLLTSAIVTVATRTRPRTGVVLLASAVVLQLVDLHGAHAARRAVAHDPAFHAWVDPLDDPRWDAVAPHYAHLALVPPPQCGPAPVPYEGAIGLAARHRLSINAGVVARRDEAARRAYCAALEDDIAHGRLADDTLYVVAADGAVRLTAAAPPQVRCGAFGGVAWCTTATTLARWPRPARVD